MGANKTWLAKLNGISQCCDKCFMLYEVSWRSPLIFHILPEKFLCNYYLLSISGWNLSLFPAQSRGTSVYPIHLSVQVVTTCLVTVTMVVVWPKHCSADAGCYGGEKHPLEDPGLCLWDLRTPSCSKSILNPGWAWRVLWWPGSSGFWLREEKQWSFWRGRCV